ncbi:MAG TPA: hypothetical protein DEA75_21305, partial [Rhodobacteraceae bacterium]|nr:hypothetical protein [Paracoccaceae bacterium]
VGTFVFASAAGGKAQHRDAKDGRAEEYRTTHDQTLNVLFAVVKKPVSQGKSLVWQKRPRSVGGAITADRHCDIAASHFWDCWFLQAGRLQTL